MIKLKKCERIPKMIKEIFIDNIATYTKPISIEPRKINFCYGSNGSGKTTLANILGQQDLFASCSVTWEGKKKLPVIVYNKKFVEENFVESRSINGIFTLGKDSKESREFITEQRGKADDCAKLVETYIISRDKLENEIEEKRRDFEETCWTVQQKYGGKFDKAIIGYRGSKKAFSEKCLQEYLNAEEGNQPPLASIEKLYKVAFDKEREKCSFYREIDIKRILSSEDCSLLKKRISGSGETPIGKFIEFLQNSDWVKKGIEYATKTEDKCPYCQQTIPKDIQQEIEDFFDETYEKECEILYKFQQQYKSLTTELLAHLKNILENPIPFLDHKSLESEVKVLAAAIDANQNKVQNKIVSPSTQVTIESLCSLATKINMIIDGYNAEIKENNDIVENQHDEIKNCQKLLWKYFTYELRTSIQQYKKAYDGRVSGIKALSDKIKEQSEKEIKHRKLISDREEKITSITPTVNAINGILKRFGFDGFRLAENTSDKLTYKIVRPDGSNAKETLSEGEYNFITFLYYYHLIYGSKAKTGIATDQIIVIDDPISSLDSNILFIVTTLVRTLIKDCKEDNNGIRQIFILTHNVYFQKEVSFLGSREEYPTAITAYWIVKKINNISDIIFYEKNPIQTSYEMLWAELQDAHNHQRVTILNTLRRILENYFNIIGGMDYEKCINQFDGEDKIICKALISCINDGSHFISDDWRRWLSR